MRGKDGSLDHARIYGFEHILAWVMSLGAIALAAIGVLTAFNVIELRELVTDASSTAAAQDFEDGILFMLPAITAGLLAFALHNSEHHVRFYRYATERSDKAMYFAEHGLAYAGVIAAIVFAGFGIVIGLDVFDNGNTWRDGVIWHLLAIVTGTLTATLHGVGHHQMAGEQQDIQRVIEERVGTALQRAGGDLRAAGGEVRAARNYEQR
jgi:hypothetical protein